MKTLISSIVLVIISMSTFANNGLISAKEPAQTTSITGKVIDHKTGEELAGVLVSVEGTDEKVYTDLEGNFHINTLKPGSYNLVVSLLSYKTSLIEDLTINTGKEKKIEVKLNNQ